MVVHSYMVIVGKKRKIYEKLFIRKIKLYIVLF